MERLFLFQKRGSVSLWDELGSDIFCLGRIEGGLLSHWGVYWGYTGRLGGYTGRLGGLLGDLV
uniref:Uncharacterized protein n=1 Tax=Meloidogyne enterolobii TaxID=390850 RepID=A0A6V7TYL8_MELEN|nr:unnamed protein product [Meloidogyne enterolobii]